MLALNLVLQSDWRGSLHPQYRTVWTLQAELQRLMGRAVIDDLAAAEAEWSALAATDPDGDPVIMVSSRLCECGANLQGM